MLEEVRTRECAAGTFRLIDARLRSFGVESPEEVQENVCSRKVSYTYWTLASSSDRIGYDS